MIQTQLKLKLNRKQIIAIEEWLLILTRVWNFGVRKIKLDHNDKVYHFRQSFQNILAGHSKKLGIPSHTIQGMLLMCFDSWQRCFKKVSKEPRLKGVRNKLNSLPFPDPIKFPANNRIKIPGLGILKFHKQDIREGKIKCGRIVKRASGYYLCLFVDLPVKAIERKANGVIGIDPGFKTCLTLSNGDKIDKPKRLKQIAERLAQAQRGKNRKLTSRLQERLKNRRKDDNHQLSRKLVEENKYIAFSKDNIKGIAKKFGRSVAESSHYQLRRMLAYKCIASGSQYVEVDSKGSTMTCSKCLSRTGPTGRAGLSVRHWGCIECGVLHDRDVNASINTLLVGLGTSLECA